MARTKSNACSDSQCGRLKHLRKERKRMEGPRKIALIWGREDREAHVEREPVFVEVPGEWAHAVFALVKISEEHRHNGLIVTNIGPGSQGTRAGMARGDVLLRYEGVELDSTRTLRHLTKRHTQGAGLSKTVTLDAVARFGGPKF